MACPHHTQPWPEAVNPPLEPSTSPLGRTGKLDTLFSCPQGSLSAMTHLAGFPRGFNRLSLCPHKEPGNQAPERLHWGSL